MGCDWGAPPQGSSGGPIARCGAGELPRLAHFGKSGGLLTVSRSVMISVLTCPSRSLSPLRLHERPAFPHTHAHPSRPSCKPSKPSKPGEPAQQRNALPVRHANLTSSTRHPHRSSTSKQSLSLDDSRVLSEPWPREQKPERPPAALTALAPARRRPGAGGCLASHPSCPVDYELHCNREARGTHTRYRDAMRACGVGNVRPTPGTKAARVHTPTSREAAFKRRHRPRPFCYGWPWC